ncbi:MAG: DUF6427 family protein [Bacteroidota bacterium]|nr:DUF6427 family protein [Bacteroidota bacterium]
MLLIYGLLLKLVWFISPQVPIVQKSDGFLYNKILSLVKPILDNYSVSYSFITFFLLYTQALSFNRLLNNRRLMQKPNYLPAMSYLLVTSFFAEWNVLSAPLLINTLLIWVWAKMSNMYNNAHAKSTLYNIGIVVGISTFFYFPSIAFSLLIIFALVIMRPPRIAEWIIAILGILTPWYLLFAWLFLTNKLYSFQMPGIKVDYLLFAQNNAQYTGIIIILATAIAGGFFVQLNARRQLVQVRKGWGLMLLYAIVALFIPFINSSNNFQYWILATIPLSAFIACFFFYPTKRWLTLSVHWIMFGFVIYMTYIKK